MSADVLTRTFHALADPTRRELLARLRTGSAPVAVLAEPFPLTQRAVSKHLAVLRDAGLIIQVRDAQRRVSHIRAVPLAAIDAWLGDYRELWEHRFDALEADLSRGAEEREES